MRTSVALLGLTLLSASTASPSSLHYSSRAVSQPAPIHVPITRRAHEKTAASFLRKAQKMRAKYETPTTKAKRSTGSVTMTNEDDR